MKVYPIKFIPILKERIWGGEKLITTFKKESDKTNIGESWEISNVEGDVSIISNGAYKNKSLKDLLEIYKSDLVGHKIYDQYGYEFPLLIKFIDAKTPLSIQVHPNNQLAKERHKSLGKNEMWYVMDVDDNSELIVGFNKKVNQSEYVKALEDGKILDILNVENVNSGDVFHITEGRVHAIGAGSVIAEIQQTSDITYRIYDYERIDTKTGKQRELHTDLALDAIDFEVVENYKTNYNLVENKSSKLIHSLYFKTDIIKLTSSIVKNYSNLDSFVIYMCVEGSFSIDCNNTLTEVNIGETILLPAVTKAIVLKAKQATILEVYL